MVYCGILGASMGFDMLIDTSGSHISLLSKVREMAPFVDRNQLHKSPGNPGFQLTTRNPPIVLVELISEYLHSLIPKIPGFC